MKSLPWVVKLTYGVGHVFNDLCASMWFSYLLIFYEKVLQFDPTMAGLVLLVGQVADGLSTPFVGILSDMENKIPMCARYGRRKVWHLAGTILVAVSFPFIFNSCLGCRASSQWTQFAYYVFFVCVFQFGWACVQISHLALIPELTTKKHQRTELNSIRYAFTVLSNLSVFAVTFLVLKTGSNSDDANQRVIRQTNCTAQDDVAVEPVEKPCYLDTIGPEDVGKFHNVALICMAVGLVFSTIFHFGVREKSFTKVRVSKGGQEKEKRRDKRLNEEGNQLNEGNGENEEERTDGGCDDAIVAVENVSYRRMKLLDWFKEIPFYQIAILYLATRLYVNLYQVYIPLYVQETLNLGETFIATVPFAMFLAGFLSSVSMKHINKKIGRKRAFTAGCIVGLGGCLWVWLGEGSNYGHWGIFAVAALLGIAGSTLLITSLSFTADLIGDNVEGAAFVYGFMSLTDKISNGVLIMLIQDFNPDEGWYYRYVIAFACGSACILGILVTLTLTRFKVGDRRVYTREEISPEMGNESNT
ncbi:major facilitator superfamily domain-containing protein 12-like [Palaemon carinicauda]|uniref:major facilitator superfamily domain-containing protein 12-like n=1 Tax=Palaemon carinicauda TaxID=392227 RepID=UPI0035B5F5A4